MPNYTVSQDIDDFMKSDDDSAARTELGLGSAATSNTGDFATSVQGGKADTALQASDIGATVQAQDSILDNTTASFTTAQESKLTAITGTNTGDQDLSGLQTILTEGAFVDGDKTKLDAVTGTNTGDQDLSGLQVKPAEGAFVDGDKTKLDGITGTNTGDQDLSGLQVKPLEGAFVDGDKTKLDGITGTNTGDQDLSGLQSILTEGAFVDGDKTKLDGVTGTNTGDQDLSALATKANVLELDNTISFTPSANFHPATKKYVDDNAGVALQNWYSWKLGNETADATIGIKNTWYAPAAGKVHAVAAGAASATSGSALALDVHKTGTTIFSTAITIDDAQTDTSNAATPAVLTTNPTTFSAGDKFEFEVDTTTAGGAGLHCDLLISWD